MKQTLNTEQKSLKFTDFKGLNEKELREIERGIASGVVACMVIAYFTAGKATREFIYSATH